MSGTTTEDLSRGLARLNALPEAEAASELLKCCGSIRWARRVAAERPFHALQDLLHKSDRIWLGLDQSDWLEAFASHPKIGEQRAASAEPAKEARQWSESEQSGARSAAPEELDELARLNQEYEKRFGYIFIICATGKTGREMLQALRQRLQNDEATEILAAAEEQRRITHLRLQKILKSLEP